MATPSGKDPYPEVSRLRRHDVERFEELVKSHLTHLLDLPGSALEEFLQRPSGGATSKGGTRASRLLHRGKKRLGWERESSRTRDGGLFGQPLTPEILHAVSPLFEHLMSAKCVSEEGIFRKCGNERRKRQLIDAVNHSRAGEELGTGAYSAHDCSEVVKLFLRDLPEPLLTHRHHMAYCQVTGFRSEQKKIRTIQLLLQLLPQENFQLLQSLLTLLNAVSSHASTRMTSETLGLLFAPHVLTSRPMDAEQLRDQVVSGDNASLMAFLIQHSHSVFKLPEVFVNDVRQYWKSQDTPSREKVDGKPRASPHSSKSDKGVENRHDAVTSCVTYIDREASAHAQDYTQLQLAQLYAHIGSMPDGAKKRRYAKRITESNSTPGHVGHSDRHQRSKSIGESLKKFVGRSSQRRQQSSTNCSSTRSGHDTSFSPVLDPSDFHSTPLPGPVQKLFYQKAQRRSPVKDYHESVMSSKVLVVDVGKENLFEPVYGKRRLPGANSPIPSRIRHVTYSTDHPSHQSNADYSHGNQDGRLGDIKAPMSAREHGTVSNYIQRPGTGSARYPSSDSPMRITRSMFQSPVCPPAAKLTMFLSPCTVDLPTPTSPDTLKERGAVVNRTKPLHIGTPVSTHAPRNERSTRHIRHRTAPSHLVKESDTPVVNYMNDTKHELITYSKQRVANDSSPLTTVVSQLPGKRTHRRVLRLENHDKPPIVYVSRDTQLPVCSKPPAFRSNRRVSPQKLVTPKSIDSPIDFHNEQGFPLRRAERHKHRTKSAFDPDSTQFHVSKYHRDSKRYDTQSPAHQRSRSKPGVSGKSDEHSPLLQTLQDAPSFIKKSMCTPGSRKPLVTQNRHSSGQ